MRADHLWRNSFDISLAFGTMGLFGFAFWALCAQLFAPAEVGVATTLVSATSLLSFFSLLGFNSTFIRVLPTSGNRNAELNTGLILVFAASLALATVYVAGVPGLVSELRFLWESVPYACGFVVFTAFAAVNLLTDSVFVAYRAAKYNVVVDGLLQGAAKLICAGAFAGLGAYGIFAASGAAATVAVVSSVAFLAVRFGYRPRVEVSSAVVRRVFGFSASSYVANLLNIVPLFLLPLIVIGQRGAAEAGYFYVAFQVANLLYAVAYAISESLFAEGSYAESGLGHLMQRAAKLLGLVILPASALLAVMSPWLLLVFGRPYSEHAAWTLAVFALAAPAIAVNTSAASLLKLTGQLPALIMSNAVYAVVICGLAAASADRGLVYVACAWLLGNVASAAFASVALLVGARRGSPIGEASEAVG
jgi:O-antigen/teichoic acid export membrane protein